MSSLKDLGEQVAQLTKDLSVQLQAVNYPEPSFDANSPASYPVFPEIEQNRSQLLELLSKLTYLVEGPNDHLVSQACFLWNHNSSTLNALNKLDIFHKVPLDGSASFAEIAEAVNLPESLIRRILRYAFTMHIFAPEKDGSDRVVHTAMSAHIVRNPEISSCIGHCLDEVRPSSTMLTEAMVKFSGGKQEPAGAVDETPFSLWWEQAKDGTRKDFWAMFDDPEEKWRAKRFADAMKGFLKAAYMKIDDVTGAFDWDALGKATVVDVGGSDGALAFRMAERHPELNFVVQDLPRIEEAFNKNSQQELADRVKYQGHDFLGPQHQHADVFFLKHILHDWSDQYAVQILGNLVPALNKGGRIVICDTIVPEEEKLATLPLAVRRQIAAIDLQMLIMVNAAERTMEDWERLATKADKRLKVDQVHVVPGAPVSLIVLKVEE